MYVLIMNVVTIMILKAKDALITIHVLILLKLIRIFNKNKKYCKDYKNSFKDAKKDFFFFFNRYNIRLSKNK